MMNGGSLVRCAGDRRLTGRGPGIPEMGCRLEGGVGIPGTDTIIIFIIEICFARGFGALSCQTQIEWDAQSRLSISKYRTRKMRALKQLKNTSAFNLITIEEQDAETATVLASIADTMTKELNETYTEWKAKTGGLDLNDSSEED